jgi:hypothetical protein
MLLKIDFNYIEVELMNARASLDCLTEIGAVSARCPNQRSISQYELENLLLILPTYAQLDVYAASRRQYII